MTQTSEWVTIEFESEPQTEEHDKAREYYYNANQYAILNNYRRFVFFDETIDSKYNSTFYLDTDNKIYILVPYKVGSYSVEFKYEQIDDENVVSNILNEKYAHEVPVDSGKWFSGEKVQV